MSDDFAQHAASLKSVILRTILFTATDDQAIQAELNGAPLQLLLRDPQWKDPQIFFSPRAQPASGGSGVYPVDPRQRLLRLEFGLDPRDCRVGENVVRLQLSRQATEASGSEVVVEKLEVEVRYAPRS